MKTTLRHHRRGTVLLTVLILVSTGAIVAIGLCQYMLAMVRLDERRADSVKAFYIAESGINRVVDFFNHPEQYSEPVSVSGDTGGGSGALAMLNSGPSLTLAGFGGLSLSGSDTSIGGGAPIQLAGMASGGQTGSTSSQLFYYDLQTGTFPNIEQRLLQGNIVVNRETYPTFNGNAGGAFGRVEHIEMQPPQNGDPQSCFARMTSTGVTASGVRKTVSVFLFSGNPAASVPAALISKKSAQFGGTVEVRWGETWVLERGTLPNWNKWGNFVDPTDPGWTALKTNDLFDFRGSASGDSIKYLDGSKAGLSIPITNTANDRYYNPCKKTAELDAYDGRILQHQTLRFPTFNYNDYKNLALRRGDYYTTDASGKLYRRNGTLVTNVDAELFNTNPSDTTNRFVFIDTIDRQAPREDGSNLITLKITGNSPHSKGLYYLNVHLDASGMGNPPTLTVKNPAGQSVQLAKVWHAGIFYISGNMYGTGNSRVFGSVISERGIPETGSPSVYYDYRLSNATYMPVNSIVTVRLYEVR